MRFSAWASVEVHLRCLGRGQVSKFVCAVKCTGKCRAPSAQFSDWGMQVKETLLRWRSIGDNVTDFTCPGIEPFVFSTDSNVFNRCAKC